MTNLRFANEDYPVACLRTVPPTAAQCSGAAHCVCSRLQPFGPPTASDRGGNAFFRFAPPCASLARCSVPAHFVCSALQPFGPSPFRTALRFACAVFRACALRVLGTSALRAFTFLQAFALQKMPEMTYTPSFLIKASFFRYFVNALGAVKNFWFFTAPALFWNCLEWH